MHLRDRIFPAVEATDAKLSFESALGKLESIVESMESGEVPLAELLAKFEEGTKLLKVCESRLKDARGVTVPLPWATSKTVPSLFGPAYWVVPYRLPLASIMSSVGLAPVVCCAKTPTVLKT